ncbi:MAG: 50S ribosomal protein L21 [Dysgonamonadaceae bacterium]|jgi:large subunit ribosomal protein L21|nr:50S ribosomal protein L21 [Dysgonamonadaceae bacterium]
MYVIVDIQGQQFKVEQDQKLFVHRINADQGSTVEYEKVMLVDNDGAVTVGAPTIKGAKVVLEVLSHVKGDKVIVFKKKKRKGYRKLNGHRQQFSEVKVKEIIA